MKIRQISVSGLFEVFDHKIPLNEEGITIIHGPNGFGKTVLLRMIDGLFNGDYSVFGEVPFKEFSVTFDDGRRLSVEIKGEHPKKGTLCFVALISARGESEKPLLVYTRELEELSAAGDRYRPFVSRQDLLNPLKEAAPAWLKEIRAAIPIRLIRTQRLETSYIEKDSPPFALKIPTTAPTVKKYSEELVEKIQAALTEYAARAQELDRTFPMRLLQQIGPPLSAEVLTQKLAELEEKRAKLTRLGFLDPEQDNGALSTQEAEKKLDVLSVYVRDTEQKLRVFDGMAARIDLFLEIVTHRFLYKKMTISRERGFLFTTPNGKQLEPESLSSGEQHELILLYEMLFEVRPDFLILIDEPEISLHIAWQTQFLRDLKKIVDLSGFSVILATHSPQLISDRWDLTVELKGPPI